MKIYKTGDVVKTYSYNELKTKIENGLEFKSKKFSTSFRNQNIFCIIEPDIDSMSEFGITIKNYHSDGYYEIEFKYGCCLMPEEFIKEKEFKLPDELFTM